MRKVFKIIIIFSIILLGAFSVYKLSNKYNLNILKNNIDCTIVAKGCEKARAITVDDNYNVYVAFSDCVKCIDKEGREKNVFKNKDIDIEDIVYYKGSLIYIEGNNIEKYSLQDDSVQNICTSIPMSGNGIRRRLLLQKDCLYITVGAVTNSGISEGINEELSPIDITLNGVNYGPENTGAFKKEGVRSENGEKINASKFGNAAIYSLGMKGKKIELYASGIRGIKGADFNSKGEIEAVFSGMNNEGLRPVARDKDYIYKIEKGRWYGWPDYSGGDPIDSPRFKGDKIIKPLLKNMDNKIVPAPIYQSDALNSLNGLAIDRDGKVLEKDTTVFWDESKEKICTLSVKNVYKEILKLKSNSSIEEIIYTGDGFLLLDNKAGCVYSLHRKAGVLGFKVPIVIIFFIFMLVISLLSIVLYKILKNKK